MIRDQANPTGYTDDADLAHWRGHSADLQPGEAERIAGPKGNLHLAVVSRAGRGPDVYVQTPWLMPSGLQTTLNVRIGKNYPAPIVDHEVAMRVARKKLTEVRRRPETLVQAHQIRVMHSSQRPGPNGGHSSSVSTDTQKHQPEQPSLFEPEEIDG